MRARTWTIVGSALALATTATLTGGAISGAEATTPTPVTVPAGSLVLTTLAGTATGDAWSYTDPSSSTLTTQALTKPSGSCILTPSTGSLVNMSASITSPGPTSVPGFSNHSLGVTQTATSSNCNRVNSFKVGSGSTAKVVTESLKIALNNQPGGSGPFVPDPVFNGQVKASAASLDVELRDDSKVTATLYDGVNVVGTYALWADEDAAPATLPANTTYCRTSEGEGDDYASTPSGDNCQWSLAPPAGALFDSISLTATAGAFGIQGGGEFGAHPNGHESTFSLVRSYTAVSNDCSGSVTVSVGGSTGGAITSASFQRLGDGGTTTCSNLAYSLTTDTTSATLRSKKLDGSPLPNEVFLLQIGRTSSYPAAGLNVDWLDGTPTAPLTTCKAPFYTPATGSTPASFDYSALSTSPVSSGGDDQSTITNGIQFTCLYGETAAVQADGSLAITDSIYLTGDPRYL